ncbi:mRNA capping enzyme, catalytic domain-containing protein [Pseudomassariella vexata]|uniref:mRNA-capping enzyme subunit alpha n=1 Tax=Pseudomassariella vexata TaxID=1141098 RepID=A0A1Y2DIM7_9PEZI|nr:mRNA capping enzyme, catalytic domain-containing protein [Pseudomassariella vexata]ORY59082.1 mRNA capping enzyme, catalytic domain-domain-containing protein [Pseudomassariella vexata]
MEEEGPIRSIDCPGIKAQPELARHLREEVAHLLNRDKLDFPGAQPVSFRKPHLEELHRQDYFVCEKSDGIRYLLYLTNNENNAETHYLIDRKNDYWFVKGNLHFPRPAGEETWHKDTILDGELVIDNVDGRKEPRYLVFDCLVMDGQNFTQRDLSKRLGYFQNEVFQPYKRLLEKYPQEKPYMPFFLEMKDMQVAYGIEMMFRQIIKNLKHGNDGLIFTCLATPYQFGTDKHILKWKPADENTVDFQWKFTFSLVEPNATERAQGITEPFYDYNAVPKVELLAYYGGNGPGGYRHYGELYLTESEWEELKALGDPLDERIIEAYMDDQNRWRFYRFRDDKQHGNFIKVVDAVLESIRDGVSKEDLIGAAKTIRDNWKRREQERRR